MSVLCLLHWHMMIVLAASPLRQRSPSFFVPFDSSFVLGSSLHLNMKRLFDSVSVLSFLGEFMGSCVGTLLFRSVLTLFFFLCNFCVYNFFLFLSFLSLSFFLFLSSPKTFSLLFFSFSILFDFQVLKHTHTHNAYSRQFLHESRTFCSIAALL